MDQSQNTSLMKHLMDHIQDNIYFMDRDGRIMLINEAGAKWLGFDSPEEVVGKTDLDIFSDEHGRAAFEDGQAIMETGEPILGIEEKETRKDDEDTWVSTSKLPLRNESGEIVGVFGVSRDITAHKEAEILAAKYAEENRRFRDILEDDLNMAAELQKTFFPTSYPVFSSDASEGESVVEFNHYYHSSAMVGGDFCSIRKVSETEVGILQCDIMGHGVRAALGTAIIQGVVEEISDQKKDPGQFLEHMNQVLMPILRKGDLFLFATACYLVLDVSTGALRYANAGHPIPILFNDREARWLIADHSAQGPALAIESGAEYQTVECVVKSGDSVMMYTDGIHEVTGENQEEFGEERLLATVDKYKNRSLCDLFPALLKEACAFSAEGGFDDDVCLVGFRMRDPLSD